MVYLLFIKKIIYINKKKINGICVHNAFQHMVLQSLKSHTMVKHLFLEIQKNIMTVKKTMLVKKSSSLSCAKVDVDIIE